MFCISINFSVYFGVVKKLINFLAHAIKTLAGNNPFLTINYNVCTVQGSRVSSFINFSARTILDLLSVVIIKTLLTKFQLEIISCKILQILLLM